MPGRHNQRIESRKGRHKNLFVPSGSSSFDLETPNLIYHQGRGRSSFNEINPAQSSNPLIWTALQFSSPLRLSLKILALTLALKPLRGSKGNRSLSVLDTITVAFS